MRLHIIWLGFLAILVAALIMALSAPLERIFQPGSGEWITVQVSTLGYRLQVPASASVHLYLPDATLRIELTSDQVLSVRNIANPARLSAPQWVDQFQENKVRRGLDPLTPMMPLVGRQAITLSGQTAESFQVLGPVTAARRTVVSARDKVFLIEQPQVTTDLLDKVRSTFETGVSGQDAGFELVQPSAADNIPNLPVPYYSQTDPRWRCNQLGTCGCWFGNCAYYTGIGDAGCYITSEAMIFDYYTGHYKDPAELDECLIENGGYGLWQGCTWGVCAASYQPISQCKPKVIQYYNINGNLDILDEDLRDGFPGLAWVDGGTHYVVVIGKRDGVYQILDPLYPRTQIWPGQILYYVRYHGPLPQEATLTPTITPTITATFEPTVTPTPTSTPRPVVRIPGRQEYFIPALRLDLITQ